jgi:hypothetical protein
VGRGWTSGHRAFRIQQMIVAGAEPQADERARIGNFLRLPAMVGLVAPHGVFARLVPDSGRLSAQVMLAN